MSTNKKSPASTSPSRTISPRPSVGSDALGSDKNSCCACGLSCCRAHTFGKKLLATLFGLLLVYGIFYLGTLIHNNMKKSQYIGLADKSERMITVSGYGKAEAQNNIAVTTIGYSNTNLDVAEAQKQNNAVMDKITEALMQMGIEEKDMTTGYTVYPEYDYTEDEGRVLSGYKVTQTIEVKIRDLTTTNEVLGLAGEYGANQVSGLSFTVDDETDLKDTAREEAIADAKTKAAYLADSLGVTLGGVINYNEYESSDGVYYATKYYGLDEEAAGGGVTSPDMVSAGSQEMSMNVTITFEILQ